MGALPAGSRILHIGPHKTGTTSVQSAFHLARAAAAAQGVHYAGSERHSVVAVQAAIEPGRARPAALRRWGRLVGEIERSTAERVVLSSEWFADAGPEAIRRIVADVGSERVRVVVTVRSLERVLPSQWQQYVAAGLEAGYEPWLRSIFQGDGTSTSPTFWHRHRHDRLIERWASVVGAENVTAIVVDDADHGAVLRAFEGLTGLRTGTLVAERDRANRSLTLPEAEVVRAFNVELNREIEAHNVRLNLGLYGATAALRARTPDAAEPRIETPAWALERAAEVAREIVAGIRAAGVEVVGDLESLAFDPPARAEAASDAADTDALAVVPDSTWLEIASTTALGVMTTAGLARSRRRGEPARRTAELLRAVSTERLARVAVHRLRRAPRALAQELLGGPRPARPTESDRPLTERERALVATFEAAVVADGLPRALAQSVVADGVLPELRRLPAATPAAPAPASPPWPERSARLATGVARAANLLRTRPGRRRSPLTATVETLDVGRVSTGILVTIVARRTARRALARLAPRRALRHREA